VSCSGQYLNVCTSGLCVHAPQVAVRCCALKYNTASCSGVQCATVCYSGPELRQSLQRVACAATHCNTLQHTATHCNTLQHTASRCNEWHVLQHTATHCNTLQHTATHCNTLQVVATSGMCCNGRCSNLQSVGVCCVECCSELKRLLSLQCERLTQSVALVVAVVAVCCSVVQCVAVCCCCCCIVNTPRHTLS